MLPSSPRPPDFVALRPPSFVAPRGSAPACEAAPGVEVDAGLEAAVVLGAGAGFELETDFVCVAGVDPGPSFDLETFFEPPAVFGVDPGL